MQSLNNNNSSFRRGLFNDSSAVLDQADINKLILSWPPTIPNDWITWDQIINLDASKINGTLNISNLIGDNSITENKILSLPFSKITNTINANTQISDNTIHGNKINDNSINDIKLIWINGNKIIDNTINTNKIMNDAITWAKIINDAITTSKILNNSVTNEKIANVHYTKIINNGYVGYGRFSYWDLNNDPQIEPLGRYLAKNPEEYNILVANHINFNAIANYDSGTDSYTIDYNFFNQALFWNTISYRDTSGNFTVGKIFNDLFNLNSINANVLLDEWVTDAKILSLPFTKCTGLLDGWRINNNSIPLNKIQAINLNGWSTNKLLYYDGSQNITNTDITYNNNR